MKFHVKARIHKHKRVERNQSEKTFKFRQQVPSIERENFIESDEGQ